MAIPFIIAAAMRAAAALGGEAGGAAAATRVPTLTGFAAKPPPLPGAPGREAFEAAQRSKQFGDNLKTVNAQLAFANVNITVFGRYVAEIPGKFVAAATLAIDTLSHAAQPFVNLVSRNNPAVTKQWELALNDAYGVLGRLMIPVVQAFTRDARKLGDVMASLEPVFRPAIGAVSHLVDVMGTELVLAIRENEPELRLLANTIGFMAAEAAVATKSLRFFTANLSYFMGLPLLLFGGGARANANATSMGAGIRSVKQVTAGEELQNDVIKNALMTGAAQQDNATKQTGFLEMIKNDIQAIRKKVEQYIPDAGKVEKGITGGLTGIVDPTRGLLGSLYSLFRTS